MKPQEGQASLQARELDAAAEAALLFAARHPDAALDALRSHTALPDCAAGDRAWLMLFELCHITGRRDEFDELDEAYRARYGLAPPRSWGFPSTVDVSGTFALRGVIARNDDLEGLLAHVRVRNTVAIDMSEVERIDFAYSATFWALLRILHERGKRVILANIAELHAAMLEQLGPNQGIVLFRRKPSPGSRAELIPGNVRAFTRPQPVPAAIAMAA